MEQHKRESRMEVRLSLLEKQKLESLARREGLTISDLVRQLVYSERREIHYSLGAINQNLRQIMNSLSSSSYPVESELLEQVFQEVVLLKQAITQIQEQLS